MIAVIFELVPAEGRRESYLALAAALAAKLSELDGFVSIERFQSLVDPRKLMSLSFWRDEQAVTAWRTTAEHRKAQAVGRADIFSHYRLRVAEVMRDYGLHDRDEAPQDSRAAHSYDFGETF